MRAILPGRNNQNNRIVLGLLEAVERESAQSQRRLAAELGIALGLVNIYLKRCVNKGLLKMAQAPARRYAYYLTPQGLAEKARLTLEYMSYSFELFRRARAECASVFEAARSQGYNRVVFAGVSDLAEIARICALEAGIQIAAVVDQQSSLSTFSGVSVVASFEKVEGEFQAVVITDLKAAQETFAAAVEWVGIDRVLVPSMLGVRVGSESVASSTTTAYSSG
jgi:DNA-binding MarR family transcriptional regulator